MEEVSADRVPCFSFFFIWYLGWCLGNIELDDYWLRRISVDLRVAITNVEYRSDILLNPGYGYV